MFLQVGFAQNWNQDLYWVKQTTEYAVYVRWRNVKSQAKPSQSKPSQAKPLKGEVPLGPGLQTGTHRLAESPNCQGKEEHFG